MWSSTAMPGRIRRFSGHRAVCPDAEHWIFLRKPSCRPLSGMQLRRDHRKLLPRMRRYRRQWELPAAEGDGIPNGQLYGALQFGQAG